MKNLGLPFALCVSLVLGAVACGPAGAGDDDVNPNGTLTIEPAGAVLEVVNGAVVMQPYTATLVHPDGSHQDVTATTTFTVAATGLGVFDHAIMTATGASAGLSEIRAVRGEAFGATPVTVRVRGWRVDAPAPANAPDLFGAASEVAAQAPTMVYPDDHVLVPPNLGELDVHWRDTANNDLYEISLTNEFVDYRIYKQGVGVQWGVYAPNEWAPLASARQPLSLTVAGMRSGAPGTKGTAPLRTVDVTNEEQRGGIYYWATNGSGILRYDTETPNIPPQKLFPAGVPTGCIGCHALSRDGTKIAITFDSAEGRGGVMDLTNNTYSFPYERGVRWNFATFNPDGTELMTVKNGVFSVYAPDGTLRATLTDIVGGSMPEISPDGTQLAYTQVSGQDWYAQSGGVFVRSYDQTTHTVGPAVPVVPSQPGLQSYYPSWSPDSKWLTITRNSGLSYDNSSSQVWVVKADGSAPPIQLSVADTAGANLTNSWARWVPFAQSAGAGDEEIFYLTFSSKRAFGTRRPNVGTPQIWMTPFYPARAAAGQDPSGPAFRLPFQSIADNNHIAQWTQRVVIP